VNVHRECAPIGCRGSGRNPPAGCPRLARAGPARRSPADIPDCGVRLRPAARRPAPAGDGRLRAPRGPTPPRRRRPAPPQPPRRSGRGSRGRVTPHDRRVGVLRGLQADLAQQILYSGVDHLCPPLGSGAVGSRHKARFQQFPPGGTLGERRVMVQEPRVAGVRSRQASRRGVTLDDGFV
jgi:hypothetical protein